MILSGIALHRRLILGASLSCIKRACLPDKKWRSPPLVLELSEVTHRCRCFFGLFGRIGRILSKSLYGGAAHLQKYSLYYAPTQQC